MSTARPSETNEQAIHHLDQLEADVAAMRRELDHCHRLTTVGTITAGLAHEINNILTPPIAYTQLAMSRSEDLDLQKKAIRKAHDGLQAASRILRAVLEFSADADAAPEADAAEVLAAAVDCLGRDLSKDGINLERLVTPGTRVAIDPLALQQTLLNLLLNARRALADSGGTVRVTIGPRRKSGLVKLTVADNGPGIPDAVCETLFDAFVTSATSGGDGARSGPTNDGGSGLGLAICRRAVENAGGTIVAHPTAGGGATFVILLPAAAESQRAQSA